MVVSARTAMTRRGKMLIVLLDDGAAQLEVSVYSEVWEASRDLVKEDRPLVVQGKVTKDEFSGGFRVIAERLYDLAAARAKFARGLRLSLNGEASAASAAAAKKLRELLGPYRNGPCPVCVRYSSGSAVAEVRLGDEWRVTPDDGLIASLGDWLKPENVEIVYA
jgi:DNA polymerase-3 subunit alpha